MAAIKLLAFAGSTRSESFNKKLVQLAATGARDSGAEVTVIDLSQYPMPLYDGDLEKESGLPERALAFKQLLIEHHGFLIASPEYNSSISGVLKNAIDWASRPSAPKEPSLIAFKGKTIALMSASPGALGGLRGLLQLRTTLSTIGTIILPDQVTIPSAHEAFDEDGNLKAPEKQQAALELGNKLAEFTKKIQS